MGHGGLVRHNAKRSQGTSRTSPFFLRRLELSGNRSVSSSRQRRGNDEVNQGWSRSGVDEVSGAIVKSSEISSYDGTGPRGVGTGRWADGYITRGVICYVQLCSDPERISIQALRQDIGQEGAKDAVEDAVRRNGPLRYRRR